MYAWGMMNRDPGADPTPNPSTIYLDADACPVKDQIYKVAGLTCGITGSTIGLGR